jgi:hypothetical protein
MPRIRTIKPEFWGDEKLAPLTAIDRLVFLGLISMADDAGRLVDNIKSIDGFIFPETAESSRDSLDTLARISRVLRYDSESGQKLIQIRHWEKHQKVDKASRYVLPAPTPAQLARESLANISRESRAPTLDHLPPTNDQRPPGGREIVASETAQPSYITRCVVALNRGMQSNPLVQFPREISASTQSAAVTWEQDGVPIAVVERVIAESCASFRPTPGNKQIKGLKYFDDAVKRRMHDLATKASGVNGNGAHSRDALADRARVILSIATEYNLLTYSGNGLEYRARVDRAAADPRAGEHFREEIAPLRLHDGIGSQEPKWAIVELVKRMQSSAVAV